VESTPDCCVGIETLKQKLPEEGKVALARRVVPCADWRRKGKLESSLTARGIESTRRKLGRERTKSEVDETVGGALVLFPWAHMTVTAWERKVHDQLQSEA
jgi:hypothetical protein